MSSAGAIELAVEPVESDSAEALCTTTALELSWPLAAPLALEEAPVEEHPVTTPSDKATAQTIAPITGRFTIHPFAIPISRRTQPPSGTSKTADEAKRRAEEGPGITGWEKREHAETARQQ